MLYKSSSENFDMSGGCKDPGLKQASVQVWVSKLRGIWVTKLELVGLDVIKKKWLKKKNIRIFFYLLHTRSALELHSEFDIIIIY